MKNLTLEWCGTHIFEVLKPKQRVREPSFLNRQFLLFILCFRKADGGVPFIIIIHFFFLCC